MQVLWGADGVEDAVCVGALGGGEEGEGAHGEGRCGFGGFGEAEEVRGPNVHFGGSVLSWGLSVGVLLLGGWIVVSMTESDLGTLPVPVRHSLPRHQHQGRMFRVEWYLSRLNEICYFPQDYHLLNICNTM